jgi:hypothetical protein
VQLRVADLLLETVALESLVPAALRFKQQFQMLTGQQPQLLHNKWVTAYSFHSFNQWDLE